MNNKIEITYTSSEVISLISDIQKLILKEERNMNDKKIISFDSKIDWSQYTNTITILKVSIHLTRDEMLDVLKYDKVFINGDYYKTPKREILELLLSEIYGTVEFNLEKL